MKEVERRLRGVDDPVARDRIRHGRTIELLDQLRALLLAVLIAFVVLGLLAVGALVWLRTEEANGRRQNQVAICDLYRQVNVTAPAALDCRTKK